MGGMFIGLLFVGWYCWCVWNSVCLVYLKVGWWYCLRCWVVRLVWYRLNSYGSWWIGGVLVFWDWNCVSVLVWWVVCYWKLFLVCVLCGLGNGLVYWFWKLCCVDCCCWKWLGWWLVVVWVGVSNVNGR